jgi:hypothetical protein
MSATDFTPIICGLGLIALALWTLRQVKVFHQTPRSADNGTRTDQRIPADELRRVGDDWRVPVAPFLNRRRESRSRAQDAIGRVCGVSLEEVDQ